MLRDHEVLEFRKNIMNVCKAAVDERDKDGKISQALYAFPPEIAGNSQLPKSLEDKLDKEHLIISIWQVLSDGMMYVNAIIPSLSAVPKL